MGCKTNKELTDNPVVNRILELIRKRGKKEKQLADYLGISSGAIAKWKYDGSIVYLKHIEEICSFLDTTPNYLFLGFDDEDPLTPNEKNIIETYRGLDEGRKKHFRDTLRYLSEGSK